MDEAFVVLVADGGENICQAFPFATKAGAEKAHAFLSFAFGASHTVLIDDHEDSPEYAGDDRSVSE